MIKPKIVVLTGAGVSAESGIATFRDADGLWEGHDIMEVATPQGWEANPALVLDFYNQRRKAAKKADPNPAHLALAELEKHFDVQIITQNVDNLHERAGSGKVIHLHGELFKSRSCVDEGLIYDIDGWEIKIGDRCEKGSQLRPHIVWFGEMVPMMEKAVQATMDADAFLVVGTSLLVYPAAGLIDYTPPGTPLYIVDPKISNELKGRKHIHIVEEKATTGVPKLAHQLLAHFKLNF